MEHDNDIEDISALFSNEVLYGQRGRTFPVKSKDGKSERNVREPKRKSRSRVANRRGADLGN